MEKVGPMNRPTYENIKEMKFLRAVINGAVIRHAVPTSTDKYDAETLRLYPIVPFNVREAINSTTWPSEDPNEKPYYIPAGAKYAEILFSSMNSLTLRSERPTQCS
jgi:hypothetical protein